ncbi:hypothetical protein C8Q80DRAFT_808093 [Daedaleopsis nitida]|nr:hypothetical protein C8Q80DRAFT_808093 [Daedaleopsis nitida]
MFHGGPTLLFATRMSSEPRQWQTGDSAYPALTKDGIAAVAFLHNNSSHGQSPGSSYNIAQERARADFPSSHLHPAQPYPVVAMTGPPTAPKELERLHPSLPQRPAPAAPHMAPNYKSEQHAVQMPPRREICRNFLTGCCCNQRCPRDHVIPENCHEGVAPRTDSRPLVSVATGALPPNSRVEVPSSSTSRPIEAPAPMGTTLTPGHIRLVDGQYTDRFNNSHTCLRRASRS